MRIFLVFARAYPGRTAAVIACLLLAGLADGIGLSSLLPLIGLAARTRSPTPSGVTQDGFGFEERVIGALHAVGLEPTPGVLVATIVAVMLVKAALVLVGNRQVGYATAHVATDLRLALMRALLRTRWQYYVHQPLGAFANAIATEARRSADAYHHATSALSLLIVAAVSAGVALLVSWRATVVALAAGSLIVYALSRLVRMARRAGSRQKRLTKSLLTRLTDTLQAVKPLRAMARETLIGPLLEHETQRLNKAVRREVLSRETLRALQEPLIVSFLAVGLYGALIRSTLPLATIIMLALLCGRIVASLGRVQREYQHLATNEAFYWSLRKMIDDAEAAIEVRSGARVPILTRAIALRDVSFTYDERWVLHNAACVIPAGQLTVFVGPSGAGKTTLADLIIGLLEPQHGAVLVDDVPLTEIDARSWRTLIGYVPQETLLLHDSVRINVTLGDPDLTTAHVEAALRAADAWDFVAALPDGIDTLVGERGLRISGGQRQRIALARALARRPVLLILDEATAGLDADTESAICRTLRGLRGRMTIVAIAHRGALAGIADQVYQVEDGAIVRLATANAAAPRPRLAQS
jgi:ATP-binding cassette subfamily C protein